MLDTEILCRSQFEQEQLQTTEERLQTLEATIAAEETNLQNYEEAKERTQQELQELEQAITELQEELKGLQEEYDEKTKVVEQATNSIITIGSTPTSVRRVLAVSSSSASLVFLLVSSSILFLSCARARADVFSSRDSVSRDCRSATARTLACALLFKMDAYMRCKE